MQIQKSKYRITEGVIGIREMLAQLGLNYPHKNKGSFFADYRDELEYIFIDAKKAFLEKIKQIRPDLVENHDQGVELNLIWKKIKKTFSKRGIDTGYDFGINSVVEENFTDKKFILRDILKDRKIELIKYLESGHSIQECANFFQVSIKTVYRFLEKNSISKPDPKKLKGENLNKEQIEHLFLVERKPMAEIGKMFNLSYEVIRKFLINNNIPTQRQPKLQEKDRDKILDLLKQNKTKVSIARMFNVHEETLAKFLKKYEQKN